MNSKEAIIQLMQGNKIIDGGVFIYSIKDNVFLVESRGDELSYDNSIKTLDDFLQFTVHKNFTVYEEKYYNWAWALEQLRRSNVVQQKNGYKYRMNNGIIEFLLQTTNRWHEAVNTYNEFQRGEYKFC